MAEAFVVTPPSVVSVAVEGLSERFPVRRIYCVGRNYAAHVREMGGDERDLPFFFQKPTDAIVASGSTIAYPPLTADFQHEVELVLAIGKGGSDIPEANAADHVFGVAAGIDLTRRDLQVAARKSGRPWEIGKGFDQSAPIGAIRPLVDGALPTSGAVTLSVNGSVRQKGNLAELIWSCAEIVSTLSGQYRLQPGDLIYTGTPAGVGPIVPGDVLEGEVEGVGSVIVTIA